MSEEFISAEEANALAASDPEAWVRAFLEENSLSTSNVDGFDSAKPWHGFDLIKVYEEGGGEGEGEHVEHVFAIAPAGSQAVNGRIASALAYVAFYGYYQSNYGTEWDDEFMIVEPRDVTIVQYFQKEK